MISVSPIEGLYGPPTRKYLVLRFWNDLIEIFQVWNWAFGPVQPHPDSSCFISWVEWRENDFSRKFSKLTTKDLKLEVAQTSHDK